MTIAQVIAESTARGTHPAIVHEATGRVVSYAELALLVDGARRQLSANRIGPGQVIALATRRTPEAIAVALAALREGITVAWVPPGNPAARAASLVARAAAALVVADDEVLRSLGDVELSAPLARLASDGELSIVRAPPSAIVPRALAAGAAWVLFTSGSSGAPKAVVVDGDDLIARARGEAALFELGSNDRLLGILPLSFDVGLNQWLAALIAGATLHLTEAWLRLDLARIVGRARISAIAAVPSVWAGALDGGDGPLFDDAGALRFVTVSGGSLPPHQLEVLTRRLGGAARVHKTYGQTETFRTTALLDAGAAAGTPFAASVGRALDGVELLVVRDRLQLAAAGEAGEIAHGGVGVMREYLGDEEGTRAKVGVHAAARNPRVVFTGDEGVLDAAGHLFLLGRADGMIKSAGVRGYPREIEEALTAFEGVVEAVAFGLPDRVLGERVVAVVVAREGASLDVAVLRAFAAARLPRPMVPVEIAVWPSLPRTPNGKPALAAIRDAFRRPLDAV